MKTKFLPFLIVSLALTAFLSGYIMLRNGITEELGAQTGTLLEKFEDQAPVITDDVENRTPFTLSDRMVVSPINSINRGNVIYYEKNTGKVFEANLGDKNEKIVSDKILPNFITGIWSPDRRSVINRFASGGNDVFRYLNTITDKEITFDRNIRSIAFSTDGNLVAYYYLNTTASISEPAKIMIAQPDGLYPKKILDTRLRDVEIDWPVPDKISLKTGSSDLFLLTMEGKLTKIFEAKRDLELKWSPSSKKIIFSTLETTENRGYRSMLWLKDTDLKIETPLNLEGKASKCTWSIDDINVYCAVSESPSMETIYKIDTKTAVSKVFLEPLATISEMFLSNLEDYLIFVNASTGKLYGIKIPR